jgi:hypothetical protein
MRCSAFAAFDAKSAFVMSSGRAETLKKMQMQGRDRVHVFVSVAAGIMLIGTQSACLNHVTRNNLGYQCVLFLAC